MTPTITINLLRTLFVTFAAAVGVMVGDVLFGSQLIGAVSGAVLGLSVVLVDRLLNGISLRIFSSATFGLFLGVCFAQLLLASRVFVYLNEDVQWVLGLATCGVFGYLGMMLAVRSNRDEFALIIPYVRFRQTGSYDSPLLVDTSVIVDGRVVDICGTGFLSSSMIVPRFVLQELQTLADSADSGKRERGRRGLDTLSSMQRSSSIGISIHETPSIPGEPVDSQLIQLAKGLQARVLSNDANLCKIARLQGVSALNLNELTKALRPAYGAGDELEVAITKEGRDPHQGVGYLNDGSMVVVNQAHRFIGQTVRVVVSSSVNTSAGRMLFAELRG